ncbi:alpha/beta fold hydrolase [Propionicicella superfundia]|uniref:alpha/beta fold hydrolase n=1 Tax=Propionicicella superfundia TaxID=348582 RepID=UPI000684A11F|nr:alpha/beta hydrolase [Propionicicella superfundia]
MEPVVCLHGAASRPATWDRVRGALHAHGRTTLAFPLLGHRGAACPGRYPLVAFRDDVLRRLDHAGVERLALVGHSLGAYTATLVAQHDPDRITRLVLEDPPVPPRGPYDGPPFPCRTALGMCALAPLGMRRFDPRLMWQVIAQLTSPQQQWWAALGAVSAPALVVAGGPLSRVPLPRLVALATALPDARVVTVAAGHRVHSRDPQGFLAAAMPFLLD